jgi:hypothetical protein
LSGVGFGVTVWIGVVIFRNAGRIFGADPEVPSENASARSQTQLLVAAVLAHTLLFFAAGAVFL